MCVRDKLRVVFKNIWWHLLKLKTHRFYIYTCVCPFLAFRRALWETRKQMCLHLPGPGTQDNAIHGRGGAVSTWVLKKQRPHPLTPPTPPPPNKYFYINHVHWLIHLGTVVRMMFLIVRLKHLLFFYSAVTILYVETLGTPNLLHCLK